MNPLLVYVSGKYTSRDLTETLENIATAKRVGEDIRRAGHEPLVPHIAVLPPDASVSARECWKIAMRSCVAFLLRCDALVLCENWIDSRGARVERWIAIKRGIPVFENVSDLMAWWNEKKLSTFA